MKGIVGYLKKWKEEAFDPITLLLTLLFLIAAIGVNYSTDVISYYSGSKSFVLERILFHLIFYGAGFLFPMSVDFYRRGIPKIPSQREFGLYLTLAILVPSLDVALFLDVPTVLKLVSPQMAIWTKRMVDGGAQFIVLMIPVLLFGMIYSRQTDGPFYGFRIKGFPLWPYWVMLGIMIPFIVGVSFLDDFRLYYPRFRTSFAARYLGWPHFLPGLFYYIVYALDFVGTEFFYRGFLILAPLRYMGMRTVLPAATLYCFVHFQKPLMETIGSFPGGLILGIIAAAGGSIFGGIIVHLGIAGVMEFVGHIQILAFGDPLLKKFRR